MLLLALLLLAIGIVGLLIKLLWFDLKLFAIIFIVVVIIVLIII